MTKLFPLALLLFTFALFFACSTDDEKENTPSCTAANNTSTQYCSNGVMKQYGFVTDEIDGKTYKTVVIGTQTWMAENLSFNQTGSRCYGDNTANCTKYGRLYDWSMAKVVCPTGWHLPSYPEWNELLNRVGGEAIAGPLLKAASGWNNYYGKSGNGTDNYGFAALPGGGYGYGSGFLNLDGFRDIGEMGYWWTTTESSANLAYHQRTFYDRNNIGLVDYLYKNTMLSVRCVKN